MEKREATSNAVDILHRRYYENRPKRLEDLEAARANLRVSSMLYQFRKEAGLTQQQLAEKVGTSTSVICRLENEGYAGHSLTTLVKVAEALGVKVRIDFQRETEEAGELQSI